ncbi:MAG TPA: membrane protein insertase YidC, partial [Aquihabitans sp.]|nr:membrane protein insertase YidC [Aquihabitans sp.]
MYQLIAKPLEFFYSLWPNYAGAIALLTISIMILLLPLTLKGTRSMLAMQKLQPELKKLQTKHRDDRQKMNEEVMKFYKENNINPMSGCLPLILQMPVFFVLYRTLYELLNRAPYGEDMGAAVARTATEASGGVYERFGYFRPKHLDMSSSLYQDLSNTREMRSFGINLAESAQHAFGDGLAEALPFIILVLGVTATSYYQQRQIAGRNPQAAAANPQQQMLM